MRAWTSGLRGQGRALAIEVMVRRLSGCKMRWEVGFAKPNTKGGQGSAESSWGEMTLMMSPDLISNTHGHRETHQRRHE